MIRRLTNIIDRALPLWGPAARLQGRRSWRVNLTVTAGVALAVLTACSSTRVSTDWDHTVGFTEYETYRILPQEQRPPNPLMLQRVEDAVRRELDGKGLQEVTSGGDVLVAIHGYGDIERRVDVTHFGYGYRWRGWGGSQVNVTDVPKGTVIIDLVDSERKELEWRGMATDTVSAKPEKNWAKLDAAIAKMFRAFPPQ